MKGICHIWSRGGRHFSPSLPGDRYLKLSSQKQSPGRNLGEHRLVRRSGTASRDTTLLVFSVRMRSFPRTEILTILVGKNIRVGSSGYEAQYIRVRVFKMWITLFEDRKSRPRTWLSCHLRHLEITIHPRKPHGCVLSTITIALLASLV